MITSIVQRIDHAVRQPTSKVPDPENYASYIGSITYSCKGFCYFTDVPLDLSNNHPDEMEELRFLLTRNALGKKGMVPSTENNMAFLEKELNVWTCREELDLEDAPWMEYPEMWEGVPNVSSCSYGKLMSHKYQELKEKLVRMGAAGTRLDIQTQTALNRTLVVNFPDASFCPISFAFTFGFDHELNEEKLIVMMNFRSLEVSTNILNDLFLFFGFLKRLLYDVATPDDNFTINELVITVLDAHIINIGS